MEHPELKTKVKHSESKNAWNVIGEQLGGKYKIARIPYLVTDGNEIQTEIEKNEALRHALFISFCFNNPDKVQCQ
jgi:hypothetical protein